MGGLGVSDLKLLGLAMRTKWPWLKKADPKRPWASLPLQVNKDMECILSLAVTTTIGDGKSVFLEEKMAGRTKHTTDCTGYLQPGT